MSREIKYRLWDEKYKMFRYWGFIGTSFVGLPSANYDGLSIEDCKNKSEQFTGLHDPLKQESYENDLIAFPIPAKYTQDMVLIEATGYDSSSVCKIIFIDGQYTAGGKSLKSKFNDHYIVIGNIHENGDLINGK